MPKSERRRKKQFSCYRDDASNDDVVFLSDESCIRVSLTIRPSVNTSILTSTFKHCTAVLVLYFTGSSYSYSYILLHNENDSRSGISPCWHVRPVIIIRNLCVFRCQHCR